MSSIICGFDATHLYRLLQGATFKKKDHYYDCNSAAGNSPLPEHCSLDNSGFTTVFRVYIDKEKGYSVFTNVSVSLFYTGSGLLILRIALNTRTGVRMAPVFCGIASFNKSHLYEKDAAFILFQLVW